MGESITTPYGKFRVIEWDMEDRGDEWVKLVVWCERDEDAESE